MKAILQDDNNKIVAYTTINPVNMCAGDDLTVTWKLSFDNNNVCCYYCGKKMSGGEGKMIQMTEVGDKYYHLCGLRCRLLTSLKQAI
jgi:hypothetical protein